MSADANITVYATTNRNRATRLLVVSCGILLLTACATSPTMPSSSPATRAADPHESVFATPEQAVDALITATRNDQTEDMVKILGPKAKKLVYSGDKVADNNGRNKFVAAYDKAHEIEAESTDRQVLVVGEEEWPMPIPLIRVVGGWQWDTAAGKEEILNRRIGKNELNVIGIARAYVEAQREYGDMHPVGHFGRHEYAQLFLSDKGKRNGLYWPVKDSEPESPLGPLVAKAHAEGYIGKDGHPKHEPYHGYFYKILTKQGTHAGGGTQSYIDKKGRMTRGFAMIAFPASYGASGVMTFIVDQNGIVYEKNFGKDTDKVAASISAYDPDSSWKVVDVE